MARQRCDAGAVTAETAVALPALVAVLAGCLWVLAVAGAQLRCVDAAHTAARAVARGESQSQSLAVASAVAPRGARFGITRSAGLVRVDVDAVVAPPGGGPSVHVHASATAAEESMP